MLGIGTSCDVGLQAFLEHLDRAIPAAVELRQALHADPEGAFSEHRTAARVVAALPGPSRRVAGTGVICELGPPPRIGIRAELDGLQILEHTGAAFASSNGWMHACGHDVHIAALTAVAHAFTALSVKPPCGLSAVFQPAEETYPSGAQALLRQDDLAHVKAVIGCHVHPDLMYAELALDPGAVNASSDGFQITITGRSGHAAYPQRSNDALLALCDTIVTLHAAAARRTDPVAPTVLSVGAMSAGVQMNTIAGEARATGTLRALDLSERDRLRAVLAEVVDSVPRAYGCIGSIDLHEGEPPVSNDPAIVAIGRDLAPVAGFKLSAPWRSCGGDDFAFYRRSNRPAVMAFVGIAGSDPLSRHPLHHPEFLPSDDAVAAVARAQALLFWAASSHQARSFSRRAPTGPE